MLRAILLRLADRLFDLREIKNSDHFGCSRSTARLPRSSIEIVRGSRPCSRIFSLSRNAGYVSSDLMLDTTPFFGDKFMSTVATQPLPTSTDPETLAWMQDFPPRPDKTITFQNSSLRSFLNCAEPGAISASWCRS